MILPPLRPYKNFGYTYCQGEQADAKPSANPHDFVSHTTSGRPYCGTAAVSCATYIRAKSRSGNGESGSKNAAVRLAAPSSQPTTNHNLTLRYHAQALATAGKASRSTTTAPLTVTPMRGRSTSGLSLATGSRSGAAANVTGMTFGSWLLPGRHAGVSGDFHNFPT